MAQFLNFAFLGLSLAAIYSVLSSSLVGIYAATGIINFAQGAIGLYSVYLVATLRTDGTLVLPIGSLSLGSDDDPTSMELAIVLGVVSAVVGPCWPTYSCSDPCATRRCSPRSWRRWA